MRLYLYGTVDFGKGHGYKDVRKVRKNRITCSVYVFNETIGYWIPVINAHAKNFKEPTDA